MNIISEYRVLRSAAGWYIGTGYREPDWPADEMYYLPYDRLTEYFATREEAEDILKHFVLNDAALMDAREERMYDNAYILTRLYFDDPISFWHLINTFV